MGVQEDAIKLLLEMAATGDGDKRGHLDLDGPGLSDALGWAPPRVNEAVRVLWDKGWIAVFRQGGSAYTRPGRSPGRRPRAAGRPGSCGFWSDTPPRCTQTKSAFSQLEAWRMVPAGVLH
jgi:hypothetical protein